jgi:hypothetical protein
MEPVNIEYRIRLDGGGTEVFNFTMDGESFDLAPSDIPDPPSWTELTFKQCPNCPLDGSSHQRCPVALQLYRIVDKFHDTRSIDEVELEVITEDRRVIQRLDIQRAIASMLDLVLPICGCPKTTHMKPLARFHLPMASEEETVFRVTGMYLLAQYFLSQSSARGRIEFEGLTKIYEDLHVLNTAVASRLQAATRSDSVKNAITLVDMYSMLVPVLLEDQLVEMRGFFKAYLPEKEQVKPTTTHLEKAKAFRLELVPMAGEEKNDDERPAWMKELASNNDSEETSEAPAPSSAAEDEKQKKIEDILSHSDLSLELEPMEGDEKPEEPETPVGAKAVFKLPDD